MPLLGAWPSMATGAQTFSAWNYWYALFLPVMISLMWLMWLMWLIWQHIFGQGYERIRPASLNPAGVM